MSAHQIERFKALKSMNIMPNMTNYKELMLMCLIQQQDDMVKLLWNDMFAAGIVPDWELFSIAIGSCMSKQRAGRALTYFSEMKKCNMPPMKVQLLSMAEIMADYGSQEGERVFKQLHDDWENLNWDKIDNAINNLQRHPDFVAYKLYPAEVTNPFGIPQYEKPASK